MQIVIDISEWQYSKIKRIADTQHYRCYLTPEQLIAHGTVLPEDYRVSTILEPNNDKNP